MTKTTKGHNMLIKSLEAHPKVQDYDREGMDEGRFMLTLTKGWAFDGAVTERGGSSHCTSHCSSFPSAKAAIAEMKWASPCLCERCTA